MIFRLIPSAHEFVLLVQLRLRVAFPCRKMSVKFRFFDVFLTDPVYLRLFYKQPCHSVSQSVSQPFPPDIHNIINPKVLELES